ncbi:MAG: hypothetical protein CMJ98_08945 [Planctomycetes bacterium]|nr:hypothetical protein [Planctomycetota bacterium]
MPLIRLTPCLGSESAPCGLSHEVLGAPNFCRLPATRCAFCEPQVLTALLANEDTRHGVWWGLAQIACLNTGVYTHALQRLPDGERAEAAAQVLVLLQRFVPRRRDEVLLIRAQLQIRAVHALLNNLVVLPAVVQCVRADTVRLGTLLALRRRLPVEALEVVALYTADVDLDALRESMRKAMQFGYSPGGHPVFSYGDRAYIRQPTQRLLAQSYMHAMRLHVVEARALTLAMRAHVLVAERFPLQGRAACGKKIMALLAMI